MDDSFRKQNNLLEKTPEKHSTGSGQTIKVEPILSHTLSTSLSSSDDDSGPSLHRIDISDKTLIHMAHSRELKPIQTIQPKITKHQHRKLEIKSDIPEIHSAESHRGICTSLQDIHHIESTINDKKSPLANQVKPIHSYDKQYITENLEKEWNYRMMLHLQEIGEKSNGYRWIHNEEIVFYTRLKQIIFYIDTLFTVIQGAGIFSTVIALFPKDKDFLLFTILTVAQLVLFVIIGCIKGYREGMEFDARISSHREASNRFNDISSSIRIQFALPLSKRDNDENFMEYRTSQFNDILGAAPVVRPKTIKRYMKMVKGSAITNPFALGSGVGQIEIVIDKKDEDICVADVQINKEIKKNVDNKIQYEMDRFFNRYL